MSAFRYLCCCNTSDRAAALNATPNTTSIAGATVLATRSSHSPIPGHAPNDGGSPGVASAVTAPGPRIASCAWVKYSSNASTKAWCSVSSAWPWVARESKTAIHSPKTGAHPDRAKAPARYSRRCGTPDRRRSWQYSWIVSKTHSSEPKLTRAMSYAPSRNLLICSVVSEIGRDTSELQSRGHLVCRLLLDKQKIIS